MSTEPRDETVDEPLDPAVDARIRADLGGAGPMPDAVWLRLERALADESLRRGPGRSSSRRRRTPLLAGLAAAAAAVVAVAVVAPRFSGGDAIVATGASAQPVTLGAAPSADAAAKNAAPPEPAPADGPMVAAEPAPPVASAGAPTPASASALAATRSRDTADFAARQVVRSGTDYTAATLDRDVMTLVDTVGASQTRLMSSVQQEPDPTEGESGFTATPEALAGCIVALTRSAGTQALVVDRATFGGADVGIVVVPVGASAVDHSVPFDHLDVWVVGPDCGSAAPSIIWHGTLAMP